MIESLPPLPADGARQQLLILLIAGHLIGDFLIQPRRMAARKARPGILAGHVGLVATAHIVALTPFLSWSAVTMVLLVSLAHGIIDAVKVAWHRRPWPGAASLFFADQAAHLVVLVAAWLGYLQFVGSPAARLPEPLLALFLPTAVLVSAFAFVWVGGSVIVVSTLAALDAAPDDAAGISGGGHLIGALERTLILILILFGEWAAVTLLLAAKSIARFEELKNRRFSEYYLVGTLTSILIAVAAGLVVRSIVL